MQAFLDQFSNKAINGYQAVQFESLIFNMADKMIEGYKGGNWESMKIGKTTILVIPGNAPTVTLHNQMSGTSITTDRLTASAAFTALVTNWYWHFIAGRNELSSTGYKVFQRHYESLRADVYGRQKYLKDNGLSIDTDAYFSFTD